MRQARKPSPAEEHVLAAPPSACLQDRGPEWSPERAQAARRTIHALTAGADAFETFFEQVGVGLALADLTLRYVRVNDAYAGLLGRRPEELIGVPLHDVLGGEDLLGEQGRERLRTLLLGERPTLQAEERYLTSGGHELWVLHGISAVRDHTGRTVWFAVSAQDITERRRAEQHLREMTATLSEQAVRDPLTGLANRALLEERLRAALVREERAQLRGTVGVLFLDLDGFKQVNDRFGHAVGDAALRAVAQRLAHVMRPSDTVARLGGDEFVVLVEGVPVEGLQPLIGRLEAAVSEPIRVAGQQLHLGVSIGAARSRQGGGQDDRDDQPSGLLARADEAMYADKRRNRSR